MQELIRSWGATLKCLSLTQGARFELLLFGALSCSVLVVPFDRDWAIAQTTPPVLQNVQTISGTVRMQGNGEAVVGAKGLIKKGRYLRGPWIDSRRDE